MSTHQICGKRGRFLCTLPKGHEGQHGRAYRREQPVCPVHGEHHEYRRGGEEGLDYICDCGAHCPHKWPDDIREEGGGHYCLLCGADGLS